MSATLEWLQFVLAPQMINGMSIGVAVVLMALGLTIIFGLLDVINMAHGEFYAIGAYLAVALLGLGLSFWWALVLTPLLMAVLGYVTERGLIQRVFHSKDRHTLDPAADLRHRRWCLKTLLKIAFGANPAARRGAHHRCDRDSGPVLSQLPALRHAVRRSADRRRSGCWCFAPRLGAVVRAAAYDRHMSASLGVPVAAGVRRHLCLRCRPWRLWRACCWRRSTRCSPPWAATSC
jgi:branched-chain amino acid transport system permease protein